MSELTVNSSAWLRRLRPAPVGAPRIICFPHAGGSASFYHPVSQALRDGTEVYTMQCPGRQDLRTGEFDVHSSRGRHFYLTEQ